MRCIPLVYGNACFFTALLDLHYLFTVRTGERQRREWQTSTPLRTDSKNMGRDSLVQANNFLLSGWTGMDMDLRRGGSLGGECFFPLWRNHHSVPADVVTVPYLVFDTRNLTIEATPKLHFRPVRYVTYSTSSSRLPIGGMSKLLLGTYSSTYMFYSS